MSQADLDHFPILDLNFFGTRRQIADSLLPKLVDAFSAEVPKLLDLIKEALKAEEHDEIRRHGHKLKGMCLNMGAPRLSELGRRIEEKAYTSFDRVMADINAVFDETIAEMRKQI